MQIRAVQSEQTAGAKPQPSCPKLQFRIKPAEAASELRAAAYLRANSFYNYPADRSPLAARVRHKLISSAYMHLKKLNESRTSNPGTSTNER